MLFNMCLIYQYRGFHWNANDESDVNETRLCRTNHKRDISVIKCIDNCQFRTHSDF